MNAQTYTLSIPDNVAAFIKGRGNGDMERGINAIALAAMGIPPDVLDAKRVPPSEELVWMVRAILEQYAGDRPVGDLLFNYHRTADSKDLLNSIGITDGDHGVAFHLNGVFIRNALKSNGLPMKCSKTFRAAPGSWHGVHRFGARTLRSVALPRELVLDIWRNAEESSAFFASAHDHESDDNLESPGYDHGIDLDAPY